MYIVCALLSLQLLTGCASVREWQEKQRHVQHVDKSHEQTGNEEVTFINPGSGTTDFIAQSVQQSEIESSSPPESQETEPLFENEIELVVDEEPVDEVKREENSVFEDPVSAPPAELSGTELDLLEVVRSVHETYPALEILYLERQIANGKQLSAWGEFDTKLKGFTENQPTGFYQTYRQAAEVYQPIYHGGEFFGGYRVGRGDFEPWYQERQTNDGGEFKLGMKVPLLRNREIDSRRAELWRATYERQRVQPEIRSNLVNFVRDASIAYWNWVAAGQQVQVYEDALLLSIKRNDKLKRRLETGDLDPPALQDNIRSLRLRESKLIDRKRKLDQAAVKLSLYYRTTSGDPLLPSPELLPRKINTLSVKPVDSLDNSLQTALTSRPELQVINAEMRKVDVDYAEARNDLLPNLDTQFQGKQDVGEPTSSKRDKSEFELEAGIYLEVPLQRRKARGKIQTSSAKMAQLNIKREFMEDKIVAEVQSAYAGVKAAEERIGKAVEARELAEYLSDVEMRKFDLGQSDLLAVFLREQYAIEAADGEIEARLEYQLALADFLAALADDLLP
ncbi:MAG: TolC family protein [Planctomycetaceae bacterium]